MMLHDTLEEVVLIETQEQFGPERITSNLAPVLLGLWAHCAMYNPDDDDGFPFSFVVADLTIRPVWSRS
jgi:hypothetical protein